ncbi:MAG: bifunctional hydroxymethylpyrimidine kinase/phosphomethylpyrimidine kinase [Thermodesulfovibrionales bacterium]
MRCALTIAGFDPSGGAGLQADLRVFQSFGLHGLSVAAALTAQNADGVRAVAPVAPSFVFSQLETLLEQFRPRAVKIGMLLTPGNVRAIATAIETHCLRNVVLDPVAVSTSGYRLAGRGTLKAVRSDLLPLCDVITPNMAEAAALTGVDVRTRAEMERAAAMIREYGARNVVITGGHLKKESADLFFNGRAVWIEARKLPGEYHGTGCAYSSAVASLLATGSTPLAAASEAKEFVSAAIAAASKTRGRMKFLKIGRA